MRRQEKAVLERSEIDAILRRATVVFISMCDHDRPYVVPMDFGYDGVCLYLHSAREGRKVEILRKNPRVCFAAAPDHEIVPGKTACAWTARYRSVVGEGVARFCESAEEKRRGLDALMSRYAKGPFDYPDAALARTAVIKVEIMELSGKQSA
jgi:nitroimidazol reductase NimA-like FMN-containing flavoprotein (pyridoxamine 5'-phosphate oxidase superfamily)